MSENDIVRMANQIAANLREEADPAASLAAHIKSFWPPAMRRQLLDLAEIPSAGLDPVVEKACKVLAA